MSILLESLKQSTDNKDKDVPGVGDSHFDDEMLSDEWLLAKLRMWKLISALLLVALIVTTTGWIMSRTESHHFTNNADLQAQQQSETNLVADTATQKSSAESTVTNRSQEQQTLPATQASAIEQVAEDNSEQRKTSPVKQKYIPQKRAQPVVTTPQESSSSSKPASQIPQNKPATNPQAQARQNVGATGATGDIVDYESLSIQQQNEMPELEISSYAVSSNQSKSFVVLNGAFYGQGETIAPNLVLVRIEKESIVVRYFDQLIRKKYGL